MSTPKAGVSYGTVTPRDDSKYTAHNMIMKFSISMALKAVLELGIPDILANAEGKRPLSTAEILAQLPTKSTPGPKSYSNLRRLIIPLVREGFFSESLNDEKQPVYGLTKVSKWFTRDNESNMTPIADLHLHPVALGSWDRLHEVVLDETSVPFRKAHGLPLFEYCNTVDIEFGALLQDGVVSYFQFHRYNMMDDLRQSGVLDGVHTLVDVGGGWGATVAEIVACNPQMQGINLDLPHVIATAPPARGVKHVAGNYLEALPSGDAMFLKKILHDHGDEECTKILKNCFKALPQNGKVIIAQYIENKQDSSAIAIFKESVDLIWLTDAKGSWGRTNEEYMALLAAAGFQRSNVIDNPGSIDLIEAFKD